VPTRGLGDWQSLLADPVKQWRAGYSAMATARSWEEARGLPPEIAAILGPETELLLAIPEHKVALPGGRRESQCDVFALVGRGHDTIAVAVEAKVEEPFGPTLGDWLADGSPGKRARLDAIRALLGCPDPPGTLPYQLFHRTAAAILEARRFRATSAAMLVHSFSMDHRWHDAFAAFCDFLGTGSARGVPHELSLPDGRILTLGWATGEARFLAPPD